MSSPTAIDQVFHHSEIRPKIAGTHPSYWYNSEKIDDGQQLKAIVTIFDRIMSSDFQVSSLERFEVYTVYHYTNYTVVLLFY